MNWRHLFFFGLAGCALFSSCAKKPPDHALTTETNLPQKSTTPLKPVASADTAALNRERIQGRMAETFKTVYFGFDESKLTPESRSTCSAIGELMKTQPGITVRIEGNADERGTDMYNLALGARRARTAQTYLINYGVDSSRISTISYGKERPAVEGHDEAAWAKNRRDVFVPALSKAATSS